MTGLNILFGMWGFLGFIFAMTATANVKKLEKRVTNLESRLQESGHR